MFRNDVSEFTLTGASSTRGPRPSYRPAVEALEERLVLSGGVTENLGPPVDHGYGIRSSLPDRPLRGPVRANLGAGAAHLSFGRGYYLKQAEKLEDRYYSGEIDALAARVHLRNVLANLKKYKQLYKELRPIYEQVKATYDNIPASDIEAEAYRSLYGRGPSRFPGR